MGITDLTLHGEHGATVEEWALAQSYTAVAAGGGGGEIEPCAQSESRVTITSTHAVEPQRTKSSSALGLALTALARLDVVRYRIAVRITF